MLIPFLLIIVPYNGEIILRKMGWLSEEDKRWFDEWADELDKKYTRNKEDEIESIVINTDLNNNMNEMAEDISGDIIRCCNKPLTRAEICSSLGIDNTYYNFLIYFKPLIDSGKLSPTIDEEAVDSQKQKYYSKIYF